MATLAEKITTMIDAVNGYGDAINTKVNAQGTMAERDLLTGTADPVAGQGQDGDVYLKTN